MHLAPTDIRLNRETVLHAEAEGLYFTPRQVDFSWVTVAARSVYHLHSPVKGNQATAFYVQNAWLTCDHVLRYDPAFRDEESKLAFLRTFQVYRTSPQPRTLDDAVCGPLPRHEPRLDYAVIQSTVRGIPLSLSLSTLEHTESYVLLISYPEWLSRNYHGRGPWISVGKVRVCKKTALPFRKMGEEGSSGGPIFDLEGRILGIYAGDTHCVLAREILKEVSHKESLVLQAQRI